MYSKELLKGTLKPIILQLLSDQGRMYGYELVQKVKERSEGKILIKEGSLYPILHSLRAEGILDTEAQQVGGRTRKYYLISQKGKAQAEAAVAELRDFMETLQQVIHPKPDPHHASS
ncbi:MAG: PadR family transcriptional regulator [Bacteroidota bacterium]